MPQATSADHLISEFRKGKIKALARCISLVENETPKGEYILRSLDIPATPTIGITGPPGAGKSTLVNAIINNLTEEHKIGVIAVDPTSPFNFGALLGDRIRMQEHFQSNNVYIRSLASRGSLGGLSDKIIEVADVMRAFGFDYLFIETVGVGQSEVEIAGLADTTVVVLVPEAGDHIQTMKAGLMEIADIFAVNKADRPEADKFAAELTKLVSGKHHDKWKPPVLQTIAHQNEGISPLIEYIDKHHGANLSNDRKTLLLAGKAYRLIQKKRMADFDKQQLLQEIQSQMKQPDFNLYRYINQYI